MASESSESPLTAAEIDFQIIRFSVPSEWSDQACDTLLKRLNPRVFEPEPPRMPRGLTHEERREYHRTFDWRALDRGSHSG